jgi:hypothetical protein
MANLLAPSLKSIPRTIEGLSPKKQEKALEAIEGIEGLLTQSQRRDLKVAQQKVEAEKAYKERDKQIKILLKNVNSDGSIFSTRQIKFLRMQNKLTLYYDKYLRQNKFLELAKKGITSFMKSAGDNFFKSLMGLLALAFLGPELLNSLIDMFTSIVLIIFDLIIAIAPTLFRLITRMLFDVLPKAIIRLIDKLFPEIGKRIDQIFKGTMLEGLGESLFGAKGAFTGLFKAIGPLIPILYIGTGLIMKVLPMFTLLKTILGPIVGLFGKLGMLMIRTLLPGLYATILGEGGFAAGLWSLVAPLWAVITPILPFVLAAIALAAALLLLWKYSDKVGAWLDSVPKILEEKFGIFGKILGVFFKILTAPVRFIVWAFTNIKKFGIKEIWKQTKKFGSYISHTLRSAPSRFGAWLKDFFSKGIFGSLSKVFTKAVNWLKEAFLGFGDILGAIIAHPMDFITGDKDYRAKAVKAKHLERLMENEAVSATANAKAFDERLKKTGKDDRYDQILTLKQKEIEQKIRSYSQIQLEFDDTHSSTGASR